MQGKMTPLKLHYPSTAKSKNFKVVKMPENNSEV
jgi:hypothetical protein